MEPRFVEQGGPNKPGPHPPKNKGTAQTLYTKDTTPQRGEQQRPRGATKQAHGASAANTRSRQVGPQATASGPRPTHRATTGASAAPTTDEPRGEGRPRPSAANAPAAPRRAQAQAATSAQKDAQGADAKEGGCAPPPQPGRAERGHDAKRRTPPPARDRTNQNKQRAIRRTAADKPPPPQAKPQQAGRKAGTPAASAEPRRTPKDPAGATPRTPQERKGRQRKTSQTKPKPTGARR